MSAAVTKTFGLHLMIDGYDADPLKLADVGLLFDTLDSLPALIGMRKIGFPHIARFTEPEIAGISGIVMIVESHISIHTYSKKDFLSMDVYSCKQFDHRNVADFIKKVYDVKDADVTVVERGKRFPERNLHE